MKDDSLHPQIEPELEARIVALVLGEASDFERAELTRLIEQQPELAMFKERLEAVDGLLKDAAPGKVAADNDPWRLSDERRSAVLAVIDQEEPIAVKTLVGKQKLTGGMFFRNFSKIAAALCVLGGIATVTMFWLLPDTRLRHVTSASFSGVEGDAFVLSDDTAAVSVDAPAVAFQSLRMTSPGGSSKTIGKASAKIIELGADPKSALSDLRRSLRGFGEAAVEVEEGRAAQSSGIAGDYRSLVRRIAKESTRFAFSSRGAGPTTDSKPSDQPTSGQEILSFPNFANGPSERFTKETGLQLGVFDSTKKTTHSLDGPLNGEKYGIGMGGMMGGMGGGQSAAVKGDSLITNLALPNVPEADSPVSRYDTMYEGIPLAEDSGQNAPVDSFWYDAADTDHGALAPGDADTNGVADMDGFLDLLSESNYLEDGRASGLGVDGIEADGERLHDIIADIEPLAKESTTDRRDEQSRERFRQKSKTGGSVQDTDDLFGYQPPTAQPTEDNYFRGGVGQSATAEPSESGVTNIGGNSDSFAAEKNGATSDFATPTRSQPVFKIKRETSEEYFEQIDEISAADGATGNKITVEFESAFHDSDPSPQITVSNGQQPNTSSRQRSVELSDESVLDSPRFDGRPKVAAQSQNKGKAFVLDWDLNIWSGAKPGSSLNENAGQSLSDPLTTFDTDLSFSQDRFGSVIPKSSKLNAGDSIRDFSEHRRDFYHNWGVEQAKQQESQTLMRFAPRKTVTAGAEFRLFGDTDRAWKRIPANKLAASAGLNEKTTDEEAFSTFSLHVSDVSFKLAQAALAKGEWPDAAKVRIEEFVNAFDYGDPLPSQNEKIACRLEQTIHPFLQQRNLLRVSMRTAAEGRSGNTPLRLTFLLDNSGSMERADRQETVRRAFDLLTQQLKPIDQVTLISFARRPRLLADRVSGDKAAQLTQLIRDLPSEGGTNLEAALQLAFDKAREQHMDNAQNRVVVLTDGAANLGDAKPESLSQMIETMRDEGIAFDAAGISADGLNDEILEALTRKGDGRYYLLNGPEDADAGFSRQIAGALRPAAKNVKVQIEFNPKRVGRYKLLGFEKHRLKKEDFRNDQVDAAEMAAAEAGVAIYQFEAKPDGEGDVGSVSVRFRDMSTGQMVENRWPIPYDAATPRADQAAPSMRIATAAALFAAKLKGDPLGETVDLKTLSNLIASLPDRHRNTGRVEQLQQMIHQARQISGK